MAFHFIHSLSSIHGTICCVPGAGPDPVGNIKKVEKLSLHTVNF